MKNWIIAFDRYFKDEVGQSPVIVHYDNVSKLSPIDRNKEIMYIKDGNFQVLSRKTFFVGPWYHSQKSVNFLKNCTFHGKKQLNDTQIGEKKKKKEIIIFL